MLIIGHRGAAALAPANTIAALKAGSEMGADILEFDVQQTRDKVLLVIHDSHLLRTHKKATIIRWSSHKSIIEATKKGHQINTLEEVLDLFFGKILLNLEIKGLGTGKLIAEFVRDNYIKKPSDWQNILFSSFRPSELIAVRKVSPKAELSMLHTLNPYLFTAYYRKLHLTAVGFHRLRATKLSLDIAHRLGLFTYIYTVNRPQAARLLDANGIDGVVTDNPELIRDHLGTVV